jgi:hypothetical protein
MYVISRELLSRYRNQFQRAQPQAAPFAFGRKVGLVLRRKWVPHISILSRGEKRLLPVTSWLLVGCRLLPIAYWLLADSISPLFSGSRFAKSFIFRINIIFI